MVSLRNSTESTLLELLEKDLNWSDLIFDLEQYACFRGYRVGMEEHHIEPERERAIYLWPVEHLAIHICHARANPTDSNHAKVGAFVKPFPGSYRRILSLPENVHLKVLSFGQTRPNKTTEEMTRIANLPQAKEAQKQVGQKTGKITGPKTIIHAQNARRGLPCTWGDKISAAIAAKGTHVCPHCGKEMKNIASNILQHERSAKCLRQSSR
jgi:hypothetical protein